MKKKEFKLLKLGDKLIITGNSVVKHHFEISEPVMVIGYRENSIHCKSLLSGCQQFVSKKDLSIEIKNELRFQFFTDEAELCDFVNNNKIKVVSITDDGSGQKDMDNYNYTIFYRI